MNHPHDDLEEPTSDQEPEPPQVYWSVLATRVTEYRVLARTADQAIDRMMAGEAHETDQWTTGIDAMPEPYVFAMRLGMAKRRDTQPQRRHHD